MRLTSDRAITIGAHLRGPGLRPEKARSAHDEETTDPVPGHKVRDAAFAAITPAAIADIRCFHSFGPRWNEQRA